MQALEIRPNMNLRFHTLSQITPKGPLRTASRAPSHPDLKGFASW